MKILGIDPGSRITGYGIISTEGNRLIHVDNGAVFTDSKGNFPQRLQKIYLSLSVIIEEFNPDVVAVENIFFATNVQSALKLGQARGAALVAGVTAGLPIFEYTALQVKQAASATAEQARNRSRKCSRPC